MNRLAIRLPLASFGTSQTLILDAPEEDFYLRLMRRSDYESWRQIRSANYEQLQPFEPLWAADAISRKQFYRQVRLSDQEAALEYGGRFLMIRRESGEVMGGLNFSNGRRGVAQMINIGYWIGMEFSGQGRMKKAVKQAVRYAFETLGFHRVEAACVPDNLASAGILLGAGFHEEGFAQSYLRINGNWRDHRLFAIVQEREVSDTSA